MIILAVAVAAAVLYASFRYPDDNGFLENAPGLESAGRAEKQERIADSIAENASLVVAPSYSKDVVDRISVLRSSGYLKTDPYSRSPYTFRYATGKAGLWIDEKSSVLVPCGSSMRFTLTAAEGSRVEFYAAAVSFTEETGKRKIELKVSSGGRSRILLSRDIDIYNRRTYDSIQTPPSSSFPRIYPSTGWSRISVDIQGFENRSVTVEISSPDREGIVFIGNPLHYTTAKTGKYNVIHIVFDAMSREYMGIYNPSSSLTPNFDAAKNDFIIFDRFYSNATKTRIYLSGMLTSQNPPATRHGYNDNIISDEEKNLFYNDRSIETLPSVMKRNGYLPIQVGNSGFTNPALQTSVDYGFSESFDFMTLPYDSTGIVYHLIRTLRERKNAPMYIYAHMNTTHKPRITPVKYYIRGFIGQPDKLWRPNVSGSTSHADALFRQITDALKKEGLWENTILIISSDHGTLYHASNYNRNNLLDDFIRTPFLVHLPDELKKRYADGAARFSTATSVINLAPTIVDLTGFPPSEKFRGRSILPYMAMKNQAQYTDEFIRSFDNFASSIVYRGRWKYIQKQRDNYSDADFRTLSWYFFGSGMADPDEALYDLDSDCLEKRNIIGSEKKIADLCREAFLKGSIHPALTMVTIFPDGKKHSITARAVLKRSVLRAGISNAKDSDAVRINQNTCDFNLTLNDVPRYLYFEGSDSDTPFTIQVFSDGRPVDRAHFLCGSYNLPLAEQSSLIGGEQLLSALLVTGKPAAPENITGVKVNLSRMDIRRWAKEQRSGAEGGIDPNMKEVLKSWGYIQ